jgi:hypothetical protein
MWLIDARCNLHWPALPMAQLFARAVQSKFSELRNSNKKQHARLSPLNAAPLRWCTGSITLRGANLWTFCSPVFATGGGFSLGCRRHLGFAITWRTRNMFRRT